MKHLTLFFIFVVISLSGLKGQVWSQVNLSNSNIKTTLLALNGDYFDGIQDFEAVYDSLSNRILIYGGKLIQENGGGDISYNMIAYNLDINTFDLLNNNLDYGAKSRYGHTAIFNPVDNEVVVFGGTTNFYYEGQENPDGSDNPVTAGNIPNNDCWAFNLSNNTWRKIDLPTDDGENGVDRPEYRTGHSAVYDPGHHQMLIFGGSNPMKMEPGSISKKQYDDVWALDLTSETWLKIYTNQDNTIKKYEQADAIFDQSNNNIVIFSGWCEQFNYTGGGGTMLYEEFESGVPPTWTNIGWQIDNSNGNPQPPCMKTQATGSELTTPAIDLSSSGAWNLSFNWKHASDNVSFIEVYCSTDGGATWPDNPLMTYQGNQYFDDIWSPASLSIPQFLHTTETTFRFKYTAGSGTGEIFYLDSIVISGDNAGYWQGNYLEEVYFFDLQNNSFTTMLPSNTPEVIFNDVNMGFGREKHSVVYNSENKTMLMLGGTLGYTAFGDTDLPQGFYHLDLSVAADGWTQLDQPSWWENANGPRFGHEALQINGKMYVLFGMNITSDAEIIAYDEILIYEPNQSSINATQKNYHLYPNPAKNELFIEHTKAIHTIEIKTVEGYTVYKKANYGKRKTSINTGNFSPGIYLVQINNGETVRKVVLR